MSNVNKDISYTKAISMLDGGLIDGKYGHVYFHSNEHLKSIFDEIDFSSKKVLTVIGSGDQAFYCYDHGAKEVDLFDINLLAIYYYYLRVWTIKYLNKFYPDINFCGEFFPKLLNMVEPKNDMEKYIYDYWVEYAKTFKESDTSDIFFSRAQRFRNKLTDLSRIIPRIDDENFNIYNVDISSKNLDLDQKYDIIFVSNIAYYIRGRENFETYMKNLDNLLASDGKIVATHVMRQYLDSDESDVFSLKFDIRHFDDVFYDFEYKSPGYVFTRK